MTPRQVATDVLRRAVDICLGRGATLLMAAIALALGMASFTVLAGGSPFEVRPNLVFGLIVGNAVVLLVLGAVLAGRLTRVWVERRRGSAGSRLHVRLVLLFAVVAVTPTIMVGLFATGFFSLGIQAWFNDRVRTALSESLEASRGYLLEHNANIRTDALSMANDMARLEPLILENLDAFANLLGTQTALRGLDLAVIYNPAEDNKVVASAGLLAGLGADPVPPGAQQQAATGDVVVLDSDSQDEVRAVVQLPTYTNLMLLIGRPVDPSILNHMKRTAQAVAEYQQLDKNRGGLQVELALIFACVALLVLSAAILIGLVLANQIARPIGGLILATERVRAGDLTVRVEEAGSEDEVGWLSRAFNRMTGQLAAQRGELMDAYSQIDERRRFTETVLSGVSAGVIGLDAQARIELPNRAASELLGTDLLEAVGRRLDEIAPEFGPLLAEVADAPDRPRTAEIEIGSLGRRTLLVRMVPEMTGGRTDGYVVTFDDITELQAAQRKAAWADVARRIAHEIKNPLTPIQLAAERLKRRFAREIQSDPETFSLCADTIIRHVGDIGRMVDEFSAFARMPQPVMRDEDIGRVAREALVLQRTARPELRFETDIPERGPVASCDRRLLGQALTNLLQNAADAIAARGAQTMEAAAGGRAGTVRVRVTSAAPWVSLAVEDDGIGLPREERERLTEPYVTHKVKGTGLGLAIVKKIMEDHGGSLTLADREGGPGAIVTLLLPLCNAGARPGVVDALVSSRDPMADKAGSAGETVSA